MSNYFFMRRSCQNSRQIPTASRIIEKLLNKIHLPFLSLLQFAELYCRVDDKKTFAMQ